VRLPSLLVLLTAAALAPAADLARLDRSIKKEPAYRGKPKYCLLVFGPEARTRVWLVLDGDTLYVDRNGNGDLTEDAERVALPKFEKPESPVFAAQREAKVGDIHDGRFVHTDLEVTQVRLALDYKPKDREDEMFRNFFLRSNPDGLLYGVSLSVELRSGRGRVQFMVSADAQGGLRFADSPRDAPVIHFDGPLRMGLVPVELVRGDKPTELHADVGTPGLGKGTFAALVYTTMEGLIPAKRHPVAEIVFPGRRPGTAKVVLDRRC
jgi:hypothetical protein